MKKIASLFLVSVFAVAAFAVTDTQKSEFSELVKVYPKSPSEMKSWVAANSAAFAPVSEWAFENPAEFIKWAGTSTSNIGICKMIVVLQWRSGDDAKKPSTLQDFALNGGASAFHAAMQDKAEYEKLKSENFTREGFKMEAYRAMLLADKYEDVQAFESFSEFEIAQSFNTYISCLSKGLRNADPETAWRKYVSVRKTFASMRNIAKVAENWARLLEDEDSAYVDYKRSK